MKKTAFLAVLCTSLALLAKAKRQLYEALVAQGFTKDEAFRIILTIQEIDLPGASK
jgi:hypothetical protein